jgi:glycosyltransferase involved in cell wall biosynthesis
VSDVVSVVIPCYNQARFVGEAIASALAQTHQPIEIVVVDDGSTDDTADVVSRYRGVRLIRQDNRGLPAARNVGWRASHGQYVIFLDADDRLLPYAAAVALAALSGRAEAAVAVGRCRRIDAQGRPLPPRPRPRVETDHYTSLIRSCWIEVAAVAYRRAALVAVGGFDESLPGAEDYDIYLRLARRFPIVDHYTEVAEYRQYPGSMSRNHARMLEHTVAVVNRHRPGPWATRAHRAAFRARDNAVWYFDRVMEDVLADLRRLALGRAARGALTFVSLLPRHGAYLRRRLTTPLRAVRRVWGPRNGPHPPQRSSRPGKAAALLDHTDR